MKAREIVVEKKTRERFRVTEVRKDDGIVTIEREYGKATRRMLSLVQFQEEFYVQLQEVR